MRQSCLPDWSLDGSLLLTLLLVVLHQRPVQAACPGTSAAGSSLHGGHAQHPAFMLIARHMTMQRQRPGQAASCSLQDDQWFLQSRVPVGWNTGLGVFCWAALAACTGVAIHRWYWVKRAGKRW